MFEVSIALLSNRCGSSCGKRRRRKLVYYGTDLRGFLGDLNGFVLDEQHRFATEYRFTVVCSRNKVDFNNAPPPPLVPLTWTELDCLLRQFVNLPVSAVSGQRRDRIQRTGATFYEQVRVLLLDDEEENVLLTTLYKLQQDAQLDGAESSERVDSYEWLAAKDGERSSSVSVVGVRGKTSVVETETIGEEGSRPATAPSAFVSRQPEREAGSSGVGSAYSRCREKIDELQQLQEIMDESAAAPTVS